MNVTPEFFFALIGALIGFVAWLVRLEARVTRADERHLDLEKDFLHLRNRLDSGKVYVFRRDAESPVDRGNE